MSLRTPFACCLVVLSLLALPVQGEETPSSPTARHVLTAALNAWMNVIEPPVGMPAQSFVATMQIMEATGLPRQAVGSVVHLAYQSPDLLKISATVEGNDYCVGREGNEIWTDEPGKHFAVLGRPGIARFHGVPDSAENTVVPPFSLPLSCAKLALATLALNVELLPSQQLGGVECSVLRVSPKPAAAELFHFKSGQAEIWVHANDYLPARIIYSDGETKRVQVDFTEARRVAPLDAQTWKFHPADGDKVETVAVSHLLKFFELAPKLATDQCPTLPPPTGDRHVVATAGKGRLEMVDGARLLFLKGSPEEMGHQHGTLLKKEIHSVAERILYGVGVGSSFARGSWFFGEVEAGRGPA